MFLISNRKNKKRTRRHPFLFSPVEKFNNIAKNTLIECLTFLTKPFFFLSIKMNIFKCSFYIIGGV